MLFMSLVSFYMLTHVGAEMKTIGDGKFSSSSSQSGALMSDYESQRYGNSCLPSQILICGNNEPCNCEFNLGAAKIDCVGALNKDNPSADVCPNVDLQNRYRLKQVNFRHNHIRHVERDHLVSGFEDEIEVLDLSYNTIEKIDNFTFRQFSQLRSLSLTNNRLTSLGRATFHGLGNLEELDLRGNNIAALGKLVFAPLKNLKYLMLDGNPISHIDLTAFQDLTSLTMLSMDETALTHVDPRWFQYLPKLETLSLQRNRFLVVPQIQKETLKFLYLSGNPFTEVGSNEFVGVPNLQGLHLEGAPNLWFLDDCAFCGLDQLSNVIMNDCPNLQLISPKAFGDMSGRSLEMVDFSNGSLRSLSETLLPWSKVKTVKLSANPWVCDCRLTWMKDSRVPLFGSLICASPPLFAGKDLRELSEDDFICTNFFQTSMRVKVLVVLFVLIFLFSCLAATWLFYHSRNRRFSSLSSRNRSERSRVTFAYSNLGKSEGCVTDEKEKEPTLLNSL